MKMGNSKRGVSTVKRGVSTVISLMVITIIIVISFAIASQGVWNLNYVKIGEQKKIAFYAAEAGVQEALLRYKNKATDTNWTQGIASRSNPNQLSNGGYYYAQVYQSGAMIPDGSTVPSGTVYFLGTGRSSPFAGTTVDYISEKQVGVLVREVSDCLFEYAVAAAGDFSCKNTYVYGSIKTSGNLKTTSSIGVYHEKDSAGLWIGEGRILVTGNLENGVKQVDVYDSDGNPSTKWDCRARCSITGVSKVSAQYVVQNDSTTDTLAFINDGSTTPQLSGGQQGEKLPNPDMNELLSQVTPENTFRNAGNTTYLCNFDLTGGVYYFPDGVNLDWSSGCRITGDSTIIVGKTQGQILSYCSAPGQTIQTALVAGPIVTRSSITYNVNSGKVVNLVAVDGGNGINWSGNGLAGGANITFPNNCIHNGLVYAHGSVTTQGSMENFGTVVSYKGNQSHTNALSRFYFRRDLLADIPGFTAWFGTSNSSVGDNILSWRKYQ